MRHSTSWRWAAVPAAVLAFSVYGVAGAAQAQTVRTDSSHPSAGQAGTDHSAAADGSGEATHSSSAQPKTSDGATTFQKPNDWQAQADPDGMTNGGVDQPGGQGGTVGEQDGNNGSGNDPDCEDDNRGVGVPGHCRDRSAQSQGKAQNLTTPAPSPEVETPSTPSALPQEQEQALGTPVALPAQALGTPVALPAQVLGTSAVRPRTAPHLAAPGEVAGLSAGVEPAALEPSAGLPNTGASGLLGPLAAGGAVLVAGGGGLLLRRRSKRTA